MIANGGVISTFDLAEMVRSGQVRLGQRLNLPTVEVTRGKLTLEIPNLEILKDSAVYVFDEIVRYVATNKGAKEVCFVFPPDMDKRELDLIIDINTSFDYKAKARGIRMKSCFLVEGTRGHTTPDGQKEVTFLLITDHAAAVYDYAQKICAETGELELDYVDMLFAVAEAADRELEQFRRSGGVK